MKEYFKNIIDVISLYIKKKYDPSLGRVCIKFFIAEVAINGGFWGFSWYINGSNNGVTKWGLQQSEISNVQFWISILIFVAFLLYLFVYYREVVLKAKKEKNSKLTPTQTVALKSVYDALINEQSVINSYTLTILNRGGVDWCRNNVVGLPSSIKNLENVVNNQEAFLDKDLYSSLIKHTQQSLELSDSLFLLAGTISSAEDPDAITNVYDITYNQEIDLSLSLVKTMMTEFNKVDDHFAYQDFGNKFEAQYKTGSELIKKIKNMLNL